MQKLKIKQVRVVELAQVMDAISPKDLATAKDIRLNVNLVNDLEGVTKELSTAVSDLNIKKTKLIKPFQVRFKTKTENASEEEKEKLAKQIDKDFAEKHGKDFEEDQKKIDKLGEKEVEFELGNDKMEKMKEWFEKFAQDKYRDKKVLVEMLDVLGIE